jgi:hypothetical protein
VDREAYVLFGLVTAIGFLVAGLRSSALRRYRRLLDRREVAGGGTPRATFAGRRADVGFLTASYGTHQPAKVQVALQCATAVRLEAHARSLATAARTALGIYRGQSTGIDELDRRYLFLSLEPEGKAALARDPVRKALLTLADRGVDHVLLTNGWLTVEMPMTFVLPPARGRVQDALVAMSAMASGVGSTLEPDARTLDGNVPEGPPWPAPRASDAAVVGPARMAALFLALSFAFFIVGPLWNFNGRIPSATRLAMVEARLPTLALLATVGGFVSSLVAPRRPALWALELSWPLIVHAVIAGAIYLVLRLSGVPEIREALGRELEAIPAGTRTAAFAAALGFGGGFGGALVAQRFNRNSEDS